MIARASFDRDLFQRRMRACCCRWISGRIARWYITAMGRICGFQRRGADQAVEFPRPRAAGRYDGHRQRAPPIDNIWHSERGLSSWLRRGDNLNFATWARRRARIFAVTSNAGRRRRWLAGNAV